jgi:hypothetical protein
MRAWVIVALLLAAVTASLVVPSSRTRADQCAFPFTPTAYEDLKDRRLFLDTIELAANDLLFPGDPYFGLPDMEVGLRGNRRKEAGKVPPALLKSIAWIESSITQAGTDVPFGAIGPSLVSFDCGHGVTQVTSGMTVPTGENGRGSPQQALVATNFAYNVARGAVILIDKWNEAPEQKPIAGTDTNSLPAVLENWYFAVWSYNGFTGPGSNRSNHPMDPLYGSWPRPPYSCGATGDGKGHNRANYPYQELVFGCAGDPPIVDGKPLWQAQPISLPDLNDPKYRDALKLDNFVFPYPKMDIPSPKPFHADTTPPPDRAVRDRVIGDPEMEVEKTSVKLGVTPGSGSTVEIVDLSNSGTGVLTWYALPSAPWLNVLPYTGVAVGSDRSCAPRSPCDKVAHIEISVDPARIPPGSQKASITIQGLGTSQSTVIDVDVKQVMRLGAPGVAKQ